MIFRRQKKRWDTSKVIVIKSSSGECLNVQYIVKRSFCMYKQPYILKVGFRELFLYKNPTFLKKLIWECMTIVKSIGSNSIVWRERNSENFILQCCFFFNFFKQRDRKKCCLFIYTSNLRHIWITNTYY